MPSVADIRFDQHVRACCRGHLYEALYRHAAVSGTPNGTEAACKSCGRGLRLHRSKWSYADEPAIRIAENPDQHAAPPVRHAMTDREREAARARSACRFLPGSFDKRFARSMAALAESAGGALTEKQRRLLWKMVYRYRRQIPDTVSGDAALVKEAKTRI